MSFKKIATFVSGMALLAASFLPAQASALSTASMTMSGATQNNGSFTFVVYANTNSDTVTGAFLNVAFSTSVSNVSYDYSVGPFTEASPSGAHNAKGEVSGINPVARVSFTLHNPGSVTASVADNAWLKHVIRDANGHAVSTETFNIDRGSAVFTYNAPVASTPAPTPKKSVTTPAFGEAQPTVAPAPAAETQEVKSESTEKKNEKEGAKQSDEKKTGTSTALRLFLLVLLGITAFAAGRYAARYMARRHAPTSSKAAEAAAATTAKKQPAPKNKGSAKKTKGRK